MGRGGHVSPPLHEHGGSSGTSHLGHQLTSNDSRHRPPPPDKVGTQLQAERFKAELHARRRTPGETLQQLYQDICRLVTLAYPAAEASLTNNVGFLSLL